MNIQQLIQQYISGKVSEQISQRTNLPQETVEGYVEKAIPLFAGALLKNISTPEGRDALFDAIKNDHDGSVFDRVQDVVSAGSNPEGEKILGHVFGQEVEAAEAQVAQEVGVSQEQSKEMMEVLAPMMMGALGKEQSDNSLGMDDVMGMVTSGMDKAEMVKTGFNLFNLFRK